jgi:hypothetical protein
MPYKITNPSVEVKVSERLHTVLEIVYAKRPLIEYETTEEGVNVAGTNTVIVWQDGQRLGKIMANYRKQRMDGEVEVWYALECHNIQKQRGKRNTSFCRDAKAAARIVLEKFTKKALAQLGETLIEECKYGVSNIHSKIISSFRYSVSLDNSTIIEYFIARNQGQDPQVPPAVASQINDEVLRKYDNAKIAINVLGHCNKNNGYAIREMQDGTLLVSHLANPSTTSKHNSTYELDQYTQEKYTMLKLLENNQFAADIGIKFMNPHNESELTYFVVAGETVTH